MSKFVVDLGEVKLSDEQKSELSSAIQQVVLSHIAKIPATHAVSGGWWLGLRPPILGIIYLPQLPEEIAEKYR